MKSHIFAHERPETFNETGLGIPPQRSPLDLARVPRYALLLSSTWLISVFRPDDFFMPSLDFFLVECWRPEAFAVSGLIHHTFLAPTLDLGAALTASLFRPVFFSRLSLLSAFNHLGQATTLRILISLLADVF